MQHAYEIARQLEKFEKEDILYFVAKSYSFEEVVNGFIKFGYSKEVDRWRMGNDD